MKLTINYLHLEPRDDSNVLYLDEKTTPISLNETNFDHGPETVQTKMPNGYLENSSLTQDESLVIQPPREIIDHSDRNEVENITSSDTACLIDDSTTVEICRPAGNSWMPSIRNFTKSWTFIYIVLILGLAVCAIIFAIHIAHRDKKVLHRELRLSG